jgi:hypothetical protein
VASVEFAAQVKQVTSRIMATGDKGGRLVIEFNVYDDALIGRLASMVKPDEEVTVTISE